MKELKEYFRFLKELSGGFVTLSRFSALAELEQKVRSCKACPLHRTRRKYVFGEGNPYAELMFVGEAPGETEDRTGRPFVGKAGELLTRIIKAMGYSRDQVYIANILKCRPPGNRTPTKEEQNACFPFLAKQIDIIKPKVIVALGAVAASRLLSTSEPLTRLRGRWGYYKEIPVMPTFHPSYILQRGESKEIKKLVWQDMKKVLRYLGKL